MQPNFYEVSFVQGCYLHISSKNFMASPRRSSFIFHVGLHASEAAQTTLVASVTSSPLSPLIDFYSLHAQLKLVLFSWMILSDCLNTH